MEGNTLIDCWREPRRGNRCSHCNSTGRVKWSEMTSGSEKFCDELALYCYKQNKAGKETSFKKMLVMGRIIYKEGCECPNCEGTGIDDL